MGDPQESESSRGPLGRGANRPPIDPGTMAKTKNNPPGVIGRPKTNSNEHNGHNSALASFDINNAVIFVNQALLEQINKSHRSGKTLPGKNIVTLMHEFIHVMQYRDIFKQYTDRQTRAEQILQRHKDWVSELTEEEYIKKILKLELQAERMAQKIDIELLNHFNLSRGRREISEELIKEFSLEKAKHWIKDSREYYTAHARKRYRRLKTELTGSGAQSNQNNSQSDNKNNTKKTAAVKTQKERMLPVSKIKTAFPTRQSVTLGKLVDAIVKFDIHIVVSMTQEEIK